LKIKIHESLAIIGLCLLIAGNIFIFYTNSNTNVDLSEKAPSTSMGSDLSPFFDHLEEDVELYLQLNNSIDGYDADFFYHAFTNNPDFTITNTTHYATDLIYFLMGFAPTVANLDTIDYAETPLWDATNGGFYSEMDSSLTTVSSEKKAFDNLLYILSLIEGKQYATDQSSLISKITMQWGDTVDEFWDDTNNAFNHSNAALLKRYSADNFLAVIVAFSIYRSSLFTSTFRNNAKLYGVDIMTAFNTAMYDGINGQESFYNTSNLDNTIGSNSKNKNLFTNALGILALLEWNIINGYEKNSIEVLKAEKIWRFLNNKLYDGGYNLYIHETNVNGTIPIVPDGANMYLLENAWMLKATLELFKHTGNTTYYEKALDHFGGIEENLYDSVNYGYTSLFGSSEKSMDSYGMLLYSVYDFHDIFTQSQISITLNQSEYIYQVDTQMNFSLSFNIKMQFSYPIISQSWSISAPIINADITYILRYTENNTIVSTDTAMTNGTGQDVFLYDLSALSSVYDYKLNIRCNKTGYDVGILTTDVPLSAGIEIVETSKLYDTLHQGDTVQLKIIYTSSLPNDLNAITKTSGVNFIEESSLRHIITREDEIDGKTESLVVVNISAREDAELGPQFLDIIVLNNFSVPIFLEKIELDMFSVVEVSSIFISQYLVNFTPTNLQFTFFNHRSMENENVSVEVNGTAFVYSNTTIIDLLPLVEKSVSIPLIPNNKAKMGVLAFKITVWRDYTVIFHQEFTILAVPEIEILVLYSDQLQILQGQTPSITVRIQNYNSSAKQIRILSNGDLITEKTIPTGETGFLVELGRPIRNPYNIGEETYELTILDGTGEILATKVIMVNVKPSTLNIFLFYVIPILIPVGIIVYFKYKEFEQIKRSK